jgi:hypothetical protein
MKRVDIGIHMQCEVAGIQGQRLLASRKGEMTKFGPFDLIVWAVGREPDAGLAKAVDESSYKGPFHVVGDAAEVGRIHDAVHQAYQTVTTALYPASLSS